MKAFPDKPQHHGRDHRPGGEDPIRTGIWFEVGNASAWSSGSTYGPGQRVAHGEFIYIALQASTAIEPGVTTGWETYWMYDGSTLLNGTHDVSDVDADTLAYKIIVGPPSDYANGLTIDDSGTTLEFKGAGTGNPLGTAMYRLIPGYRPPKKRYRSSNDEFGGHICLTVDADGYVYRGFV